VLPDGRRYGAPPTDRLVTASAVKPRRRVGMAEAVFGFVLDWHLRAGPWGFVSHIAIVP
jgi:hypothetical protein